MATVVNGYTIEPEADLSGADLSDADLSGAELSGADLIGANLTVADLIGANLDYADLTLATLNDAELTDANLSNANLSYARLNGASLSDADLSYADLTIAELSMADLSYADLSGADLIGANLTVADLIGANLTNADLTAADLSDAYLSGADLTNADLTDANLTGVNSGSITGTPTLPSSYSVISGHIVGPGANLTGADLSSADLSYADLYYADLTGADLTGADLTDAYLTGADLTRANIYKATFLDGLTSDQLASTVSKVPTPTIDLNDADGRLVAYEIKDWDGLSGTAYPNTTLTLVSTYTKNSNSQSYQILTDANGIWRLTNDDVGYNPPEGTYSLSITAKDGDGLVSEQASATLIFDLGTAGTDFDAPTISLNDPNNDGIIDGSEYDSWAGLSGTAAANSTVIMVSTDKDNGDTGTRLTTADSDGNWTIPKTSELDVQQADGTFDVSVTYTDNVSKISKSSTVTLKSDPRKVLSGTDGNDTFKVIANAGKYFVDGVQAPELELISGKEYAFDLSDSSLSSHPLAFKIDGQPWDEAVTVTGTRGVDQIIKITIPSASQGVLSYYCTNHSGMGNDAIIVANKIFGTDDGGTLVGLSGDDVIEAGIGDDILEGGAGDDILDGGSGDDTLDGGAGDDTIILESNGTFGSELYAYNTTSSLQAGTEESINLAGKTRFGDVMDGGANVDTVELTDGSDAFFLHDSFGGFHSSLTLVEDYDSRLGTARIANIENINSGLGNDIVDLTSPDYSLAGQNITIDGGSGDDTLWGSDADETLKGGVGDDELFGGAGTNVLTGGAGADEFQFTKTSINDTIKDFSLIDGDTLKFFNKGGAKFDRDSVALNGDVLSISDGTDVLTITLEGTNLQLGELESDVLIIG